MSDYTEFFLSSPSAVALLECLDITHPNFTKPYYLVRNKTSGVSVTIENGGGSRSYLYAPLSVKPLGFKDDMDQGFSITFGDITGQIAMEMEAIEAANGFGTPPTFIYRGYRSDDTSIPLEGPITLEIRKISTSSEGTTFEATAPQANAGKTGELYRLDRFPMLRGLL